MYSLEATVEKILSTRRITRQDQHLLMVLGRHHQLSHHDVMLIDRIYDALHQGRLRVID
ncbi:hypothetical protein XM38_020360 [Halomicronema hongdechloris C2206]|uniref:Uncharacterized protein n=1 Tax=Halomicronema hongdechloris C2206 TaxID=1641165 RepID=A0A1Z3HLD9_9CYAN|nr:hypothetical protein [Halomicronema hongdechloris]ASC71086.1 hypothetical protein XM38_020360 [Halomicronema hongdechloris C2206]